MKFPTVHHWLVCRRGKAQSPVGPLNPYTLRGVSYRYVIPATIGLSAVDPYPAKLVCVFARFYGGEGPVDFEIHVQWIDDPATVKSARAKPEVYGPFTVHFRPGEAVRDFLFRLRNVPLYGIGRYAVRLIPVSSKKRVEVLATEYFEVVQA